MKGWAEGDQWSRGKVQTKAEMKPRCSTETSLRLHWRPSWVSVFRGLSTSWNKLVVTIKPLSLCYYWSVISQFNSSHMSQCNHNPTGSCREDRWARRDGPRPPETQSSVGKRGAVSCSITVTGIILSSYECCLKLPTTEPSNAVSCSNLSPLLNHEELDG